MRIATGFMLGALALLPRPAAAAPAPEAVVQGQVDAFNRGDTIGFASFYASEVEFRLLGGDGRMVMKGRHALVARYEPMFRTHPHAAILSRTVSGAFVVDKERTSAGGRSSEGLAIYEVRGRQIVRVWFTP